MAIGPEQQRLTPAERANLVAYLDGELNEAEQRAIATKLTHSPTARREVEVLEKTWELLEHLPRPRAAEDFTERTLSGVRRLDERGGNLESAVKGAAGRFAAALLWPALACVAFLAGSAGALWAWPNPTARLARELPLAEHLDEYLDVRDVVFLKELLNSPEFGTEGGH